MAVSIPTRDALKDPLASNSPWRLPLGADRRLVPAALTPRADRAMFADPDVIVMRPTAPALDVYENKTGWGAGDRCIPQSVAPLFSAPVPSDFLVPCDRLGPHGTTPNYATAILRADGRSLVQGQPIARRDAGGPGTIMWHQEKEDLFGHGISGAHGGSNIGCPGGTIRLGELVPDGRIAHPIALGIHPSNFANGFRWPASKTDAGGTGLVQMGALLALPATFDPTLLESEPGRILARCLKEYGGYVVDNTGPTWNVINLSTEFSPDGDVSHEEFPRVWGMPFSAARSAMSAWLRDCDKIFDAVGFVDNWDLATWLRVAASNGAEGAGGGERVVEWAPPLGTIVVGAQFLPSHARLPRVVLPPVVPPPPADVATDLTLNDDGLERRIGVPFALFGRLTRRDTGAGMASRTIRLGWVLAGVTVSLGTTTTGMDGDYRKPDVLIPTDGDGEITADFDGAPL